MTDTITSLIEKLEGAEKPSQELSARVIHAVRVPDGSVEQSKINGRWCVYDKNGRLLEGSSRNGWWREGGWEVTESLDAALALAERVGVRPYQADASIKGKWSWMVVDEARLGDLEANPYARATAATPALALCAALLRAQSEAR